MERPVADDIFPAAGFRARRWSRFERDLGVWAESPEGRFARWQAERQIGAPVAAYAAAAHSAQRPRSTTSA